MITIENKEFEIVDFLVFYCNSKNDSDLEFNIKLNGNTAFRFFSIGNKIFIDKNYHHFQTEHDFYKALVNLTLENLKSKLELNIQNLETKDITISTHSFDKFKLMNVICEKLNYTKDIFNKLNKLDCKFKLIESVKNDNLSFLSSEKLSFDEILSRIKISGYDLLHKLFDLYKENKLKIYKSVIPNKKLNDILKIIDENYKFPYIKNIVLDYVYEDLNLNSYLELIKNKVEVLLGPKIANSLVDDIKKLI